MSQFGWGKGSLTLFNSAQTNTSIPKTLASVLVSTVFSIDPIVLSYFAYLHAKAGPFPLHVVRVPIEDIKFIKTSLVVLITCNGPMELGPSEEHFQPSSPGDVFVS